MPVTNFQTIPRELQRPTTDIPILDWWKEHYEKVFVAFNPFYRLPVTTDVIKANTTIVDGKDYISPGLIVDIDLKVNFYDYTKQNAETVTWSAVHNAVCPEVPFAKFALCVWISSCLGRREDVPANIQEAIGTYCLENALFLPQDDVLSPALEPKVGEFLSACGVKSIDIYDEFRNHKETHSVAELSRDYPSLILPDSLTRDRTYCIHATEIGLVMIWEFDGVEAMIGLSKEALKVATPEKFFEGFYADCQTYTDWANPLDFVPRQSPEGNGSSGQARG